MALTGNRKKTYQRNYMRNKRHLIKQSGLKGTLLDPVVRPPLYNPATHRAGDRVLVYQGRRLKEMIIPQLDADGNPIPE